MTGSLINEKRLSSSVSPFRGVICNIVTWHFWRFVFWYVKESLSLTASGLVLITRHVLLSRNNYKNNYLDIGCNNNAAAIFGDQIFKFSIYYTKKLMLPEKFAKCSKDG